MRLRKGQRAVEMPVTVGDKGVRGPGSQDAMVGTGTHSPPNVVVEAMSLQGAMQTWVRAWILQKSPQIQAPPPPHWVTQSKIHYYRTRLNTGCAPWG